MTMSIDRLERELKRLERESLKWAERRFHLPRGSSRARVTTANARWARVAEARDQVARLLEEKLYENAGTSQ